MMAPRIKGRRSKNISSMIFEKSGTVAIRVDDRGGRFWFVKLGQRFAISCRAFIRRAVAAQKKDFEGHEVAVSAAARRLAAFFPELIAAGLPQRIRSGYACFPSSGEGHACAATELRMLRQGPAAAGSRRHDLHFRMHVLPRLVDHKLGGRCPNCGGNFAPRPIRPADALARHPASTQRVFHPRGCGKAA